MKAKRILSAAAAVLTALSLTACSTPPSREEMAARTAAETAATKPRPTETTAAQTSPPKKSSYGFIITFGDAVMKWDELEKKDYVIQTINFKNMTGKDMSFSPEFSCKAFQNGVECSPNYLSDAESNEYLTVQNGGTISIYYSFFPRDYNNSVEIIVYSDYGDTEVSKLTLRL